MARRRKSKESAGAEAVGIIIILAVAFFMLNGSSSNPVAAAVLSTLKTPLILLICFVAVMAVIRFLAAQNSSKAKPQKKQSYQKAQRPTKPKAKIDSIRANDMPKPTEWSEALINQLEWRVFEKLCTRLWEEKGFSAKETNAGADGGVDFYLYANSTKQKIGAVQCKSWGKKQIGVSVLRELQGVVASEQLKLGLLMYSGELSKAAKEFLALSTVSIKSQGSAAILAEIEKLNEARQQALLREITVGDYTTPSCPNCDVKLVERTAQKTGKVFWGCSNFPRCRHVMN
ncbi:restriction endonuclease [Arenicella xantha]|uniref:Restriction system protein n=1 Tax=Arenicella xantha TaxID=644221 RepID=A0A395JTK2_9GAMM|nr:restriction endonuclease [Arenicella xantha]RBP52908.1 restriction system protein [Arenicella xantha]